MDLHLAIGLRDIDKSITRDIDKSDSIYFGTCFFLSVVELGESVVKEEFFFLFFGG